MMTTIINLLKKYFILLILTFIFSCSQKNEKIVTTESLINRQNFTIVHIPEEYDNILQFDSIFEKIEIVPLETDIKCLISTPYKVLVKNDLIYIQNTENNLFIFNSSGKFIREIGRKGRGPNEFYSVRDFDIDSDGNILILDFNRILKFTTEGVLLKKYMFNFSPEKTITCNPLQFALCGEDEFYIWGGSFSLKNNDKQNLFALYKMTGDGEINERYFPVKHKMEEHSSHFDKCKNYYNITPIYGIDTIYKATVSGVEVNYAIDFGKLSMKQSVPLNFYDLSNFKADIDQKYANSIRNIVETDEWLYFMFGYKGYAKNVYYSKKLQKSFVSKPYPRLTNQIMPWMINSKDENDLIALIEPRIVLEDLNEIKVINDEIKTIKNVLRNTNNNDNHLVVRCKMKKY